MKALGIDPGTRVLGYGVIEVRGSRIELIDAGALKLGKESGAIQDRLLEVHAGVEELLRAHTPDCLAIEEAFHGRSAQAALRIGEARGVVIVAARLHGVEVFQYPPATVKKALTGNGRADKAQVGAMVTRLLGLAENLRPADASDAVAIAMCHCFRRSRFGS